jgi:hypothetical protein
MKIYEKLLTIQKRVNGLGKDKSTYNYKYVTGDKLLGEIKPMMNDLGLLLKQEILSIENSRQDYETSKGSKSEILSKVMMKFTWIDVETGYTDENLFGANGQNDWEKGLGSALTYGERYFLLKYFHIATDEDDIDNDQRKTSAPVPLKEELTELDWINLAAIFEKKSEIVPAEKFDAIKSAVYGKNPKFYEYTLATLNKL